MNIPIRKAQAGSDSHGYSWPEDGAVVRVPREHAEILLAIPDGGFSVDENGWAEPQAAADAEPGADGESGGEAEAGKSPEFSEVDPGAVEGPDDQVDGDAESAKPAAKKTASRRPASKQG